MTTPTDCRPPPGTPDGAVNYGGVWIDPEALAQERDPQAFVRHLARRAASIAEPPHGE